MKKYLTLFTTGIILILSSCATNSDIDNLQSQIDGLKSGQIATIENQINSINGSITSLQEADREIKGYITTLQNTATELQRSINSINDRIGNLEKELQTSLTNLRTYMETQLSNINTAIENLQEKDKAIEKRIDDLKGYVDTQLKNTKDWVSATFATLEQYQGVVSEIEGVKAGIRSINTAMEQMEARINSKIASDIASAVSGIESELQQQVADITQAYKRAISTAKSEIEAAYTQAIADAISSSETSIKGWVNEQLKGYWTIAETKGKLEELRGNLAKEDESIREDLDKLSTTLDSAKTELTEGYKAAIKKAIDENNGILDGKIAEAVSGLNTRIDGEVSTINKRIGALEDRVSRLEKYLLSRIQSLSYIPRYDDGASTMWLKTLPDGTIEARDTLEFRVSPVDCADALVEVWESAVSAEAVSVLTRGSQQTIPLPVVSVTGGNGKISIILDGSSLREKFFSGEQKMKVVVIISDGNNELTSDYISMVPKVIKSFIEVESVTINPQLANLEIGETLQLSATVLPSDASDNTVTWASSKQSVATVSNSGLVTALAEGTSTVTASCGGKSATCQVTVSKGFVEVTSVSLNKEELALIKGQSESLVAKVNPSDATDKTVTWDSSDKGVASVDANGKVTAVAGGITTITAKAGDKQASCTVTVTVPIESISLDQDSITLGEEQSVTLVATVKPDDATNKTVTWSSSDNQIATVDESGKVTAIKEGSAIITAKAGDKTATCSVTVKAKVISVTGVSLDKTSLTMTEGDTQTLIATVTPSNATNKSVTWSSNAPSVAEVSSSGVVIAKSEGSATITVRTTDGGKTASCYVVVNKKVIPVSSVSLNKTSLSLIKGQSETLTATVSPSDATDKTITWNSSNTFVATVDQDGKVTAVGAGSAVITVTTKDGSKTATCDVTVVIPVTSVSLNKTELTIEKGKTETLTATVNPSDASDKTVTWTTSDASVATVSNGVVTAKNVGTATITAKAGDKSATCVITVSDPQTEIVGEEEGEW